MKVEDEGFPRIFTTFGNGDKDISLLASYGFKKGEQEENQSKLLGISDMSKNNGGRYLDMTVIRGWCKNRSQECENLAIFYRESKPFNLREWIGDTGVSKDRIQEEEKAFANVSWSWPNDPEKEPF